MGKDERISVMGAAECKPLLDAFTRYSYRLPAEDLYDALNVGIDIFLRPTYYDAAAPKMKDLFDKLTKMKRDLVAKDKNAKDAIGSRFDPAIDFFKKQLGGKGRVELNCVAASEVFTAGGPEVKLQTFPKIDTDQIAKHLKEKFNFETNGAVEKVLHHKAFYSDIKKDAGDLVFLVADIHNDKAIATDGLLLLDRLIKLQGVNVVEAAESSADEANGLGAILQGDAYAAVRKNIEQRLKSGESISSIFDLLTSDKAEAAFCAKYTNPATKSVDDMSLRMYDVGKKCSIKMFILLLRETLTSNLLGGRKQWVMDDNKLTAAMKTALSDLATKHLDRNELKKATDDINKYSSQRSKIMADGLAEHLKTEPSKLPRIVVFTVGAAHIAEVLKEIQSKKPNASVIGLMSADFFNTFRP